jgi:hypothetical protein
VRILLDECVHIGVKAASGLHIVQSVAEIGWRSSNDGPLLAFAQDEFDVFVRIDGNLEHQQNLARLKLGFVVARGDRELALKRFAWMATESVHKGCRSVPRQSADQLK